MPVITLATNKIIITDRVRIAETPCGKSRRTDRSSDANYLRLGGGTAVSICILSGAEVGLGSTLFRQRLQISDNVLPVFFVWH